MKREMKFISWAGLFVIVVVAGCFLRGFRSQGGNSQPSPIGCAKEAEDITEAVFGYQMENPDGHKSSDLFFLSVANRRDPNSELITRLLNRSYRVKPVSQSLDERTVIRDKQTREAGVILNVGTPKWLDDRRVEVALSMYSGFGDAKGYVYEIVCRENGWTVSQRRVV
jgi:hypothetical protein